MSHDGTPVVAVLGAGRLGEAILTRFLAAGQPADRLRASVRTPEQAARLAAAYSVAVHTDTARTAQDADVAIVTVRPEHATEVVAAAGRVVRAGAAVVSFVAGRPLGGLGPDVAGFRVATNAVAVERGGLLALTAGPEAGEEQVRRVRLLLSRLGTVITVPEAAQDLAAATLGSGAAFLVCAAGGVLEAAAPAGREAAVAFTVDALRTAALILERAPESGAAWDALATPGGITAAGLRTMIDDRVSASLAAAVGAALSRAAALAPS